MATQAIPKIPHDKIPLIRKWLTDPQGYPELTIPVVEEVQAFAVNPEDEKPPYGEGPHIQYLRFTKQKFKYRDGRVRYIAQDQYGRQIA